VVAGADARRDRGTRELGQLAAGRVGARGGAVGAVISGGNVDAARFAALTAA